jgi:hypothetical protein
MTRKTDSGPMPVIEDVASTTPDQAREALRAAAGWAADAAELRMFTEMLGIHLPEKRDKKETDAS